MKFALAALAAVFNYVQADMPSKEVADEKGLNLDESVQSDDMMLTPKQNKCFFTPDSNCTSTARTGFDKSVTSWTQYYNSRSRKYALPLKVRTETYDAKDLPTLWNSLNWAKNHLAQHTNIDVQFIDDFDRDFYFNKGFLAPFNGGDCASFVGDVSHYYRHHGWWQEGQMMNFGWCLNRSGSIVHEIMHALGFVHEHSRHDRNEYLDVRYDGRFQKGTSAYVNCQPYSKEGLDTSGLPYDFGSIMHYPQSGCYGMKPKRKFGRVHIGQRTALSKQDIMGINDIYAANGPKYARDV